jgi:hypothetical protein
LTTQIDAADVTCKLCAIVGSAVFVIELESTVMNVPSDVATRAQRRAREASMPAPSERAAGCC